MRTGFSILSKKAFGWVGGSAQSARKNYKLGKNSSTKKSIYFCKKMRLKCKIIVPNDCIDKTLTKMHTFK